MVHDEDILREATALVDRAQLELNWCGGPVYIGFRRSGALSLFLGENEVYQFDTDCRWRRGFFGGRLLKADRGKLVELERVRTADAHVLQRYELTVEQQASHRARLEERLDRLAEDLEQNRINVLGTVTEKADVDICGRLRDWLAARPVPIEISSSPRLK